MIPQAYGGWIWWRHPLFKPVTICPFCVRWVSKWHEHWPLDEDDPQFAVIQALKAAQKLTRKGNAQ